MSIDKCIFCGYAVIHKNYDCATNAVIACRQHQDIFAPVCQYQFINTYSEKEQIDIVKCGECKYSETYITDVDGEIIFCRKENALYRQVTAEDFCSKGRRA